MVHAHLAVRVKIAVDERHRHRASLQTSPPVNGMYGVLSCTAKQTALHAGGWTGQLNILYPSPIKQRDATASTPTGAAEQRTQRVSHRLCPTDSVTPHQMMTTSRTETFSGDHRLWSQHAGTTYSARPTNSSTRIVTNSHSSSA